MFSNTAAKKNQRYGPRNHYSRGPIALTHHKDKLHRRPAPFDVYHLQYCIIKKTILLFASSSAGLTIAANVAIATGPALLGGPPLLFIKFVLYCMQRWILEFRKTLRKEVVYFTHAIKNLYSLKAVNFFIFFGDLLLRERQLHIANCLKSFDFKLFSAYTVAEGTILARLHTYLALFCQTYGLL